MVVIPIASAVTILLNSLVIVAIKRRKELQKPVNILLASLAVADLLAGAISMPLSTTVDILILHQFSLQKICTLDAVLSKPMFFFVSFSSIYHLTATAWERYVAIEKFIDYKVMVTKSRLQKLSITAWFLAAFRLVFAFITAGVEVDRDGVQVRRLNTGLIIVALICLVAIAYFYIMVYLGMRKRKINEISQVNALMKAKMEAKVAKTTVLLTGALICPFVPAIGVVLLANVYPVFTTNSLLRLMEVLVQSNSLVNPILYSYRDCKIRKAVLELLGIRKSHASQPEAVAPRFAKTIESYGSVGQTKSSRKLVTRPSSSNKYVFRQLYRHPRMTRSASCDAAISGDFVHALAKAHEIVLRRRHSA